MKHQKIIKIKGNCPHCNSKHKYSEKYDAYYCPKCMYWLEKICPDRNCEFCKDRPKYPPKSLLTQANSTESVS